MDPQFALTWTRSYATTAAVLSSHLQVALRITDGIFDSTDRLRAEAESNAADLTKRLTSGRVNDLEWIAQAHQRAVEAAEDYAAAVTMDAVVAEGREDGLSAAQVLRRTERTLAALPGRLAERAYREVAGCADRLETAYGPARSSQRSY